MDAPLNTLRIASSAAIPVRVGCAKTEFVRGSKYGKSSGKSR